MSCKPIKSAVISLTADHIKESVIQSGSIANIAGDAKTTIVTYTNSSDILWLDGFACTGTVDAEFILVIDTIEKVFLRSAEMDRNVQITFPKPIKISIGSIIDIKVTHFDVTTEDFDATLFGHRI